MRMLYERLMAKHIQNIIAAIKELGHQAETQPDLLRDATGDPTRLTKVSSALFFLRSLLSITYVVAHPQNNMHIDGDVDR